MAAAEIPGNFFGLKDGNFCKNARRFAIAGKYPKDSKKTVLSDGLCFAWLNY
jgi:hypothetical protein